MLPMAGPFTHDGGRLELLPHFTASVITFRDHCAQQQCARGAEARDRSF
jgi:hypothetical protein